MNATDFLALLLRTGLVLALALGADAFLRRAAAVRSFLLRAALAAAVVAAVAPLLFQTRIRPVVALASPSVPVAVVAPLPEPVAAKPTAIPNPVPVSNVSDAPAPVTSPVAATAVVEPAPSPAFQIPAAWPMLLWALGAAACGAYWFVAHCAVLSLRRRGRPVTGMTSKILVQICDEQDVEIPVLRHVPGLASPLACGVFRPCILLPYAMTERGDRTELTAALAHEVAHLARRDVAWTYVTRLVQSVLWFQPLVWGLHRRMVAASEELCDLQAVQSGLRRETYADCLLRLAEAASRPRIETALGSGMATKRSSLATRIEALLDNRRVRITRLNARTRTLIGSAVAALAVAGGIFVAVPAKAEPQQKPSGEMIPGTEKEGRALYDRTRARYQALTTLSFTAVTTGSHSTARVKVWYQRPDKVRAEVWQNSGVAEPRRLVILDGKTVTIYDESEPREVVVSPISTKDLWASLRTQAPVPTPLALQFAAASSDAEKKHLAWQTHGSGFGLTGKDGRSLVIKLGTNSGASNLTLRLDEAGNLLEESSSMNTQDGKRYQSTTTYSDVRTDEALPEDTFRFKTPKGAKVVAAFRPERHVEPAAIALAQRIEKAGQGLESVAFEVERMERITQSKSPASSTRIVRKIEYRKDGSARIEEDYPRHWGDVLIVSNGKELIGRSEKSRRKVVRQTLAKDPHSRVRQLLMAAEYRVPQTAYGQYIEMSYLGIGQGYAYKNSVKLGAKTRIDGEPMDVLVLETRAQKINGAPAPGKIVERVFADSHGFIRRYEKRSDFGTEQVNEEVAVVRNLRINPTLPDSRFRLEIPAGYSTISTGSLGLEETYRSYQPIRQLDPGEVPPATPFQTLDGRTLTLPSLKGKVVLIQGWAADVVNYREDLPRAQALHKKYGKDGLVVIAMGFYEGSSEGMRKYLAKKGYTFTNVLDGPGLKGRLTKPWNIRSFPFQVIIGRDGIVKARNVIDRDTEVAVKRALEE